MQIIKLFCVASAGGAVSSPFSQADLFFAIALLLLTAAAALVWRNQRKLSELTLQNQAEIARLERICAENQQRISRTVSALPTSIGQEALFNRVRQSLATSYARTQNRLMALEAIDLDSMRIDISQLQADHATIQESLQAIFQELSRVQLLEQYVMQLQTYEAPPAMPPEVAASCQAHLAQEVKQELRQELRQEIDELRHRLADLPRCDVVELQSKFEAMEQVLFGFDHQLAELGQRFQAPVVPHAASDEIRVLQVLKQKIQELEAILHPDQSFELPTGMGLEMRFVKLIKRSDAIAICDKLARLPDLQVPSATISWVRSRYLVGIRGLETMVYRNRYGSADRYILLHEAINLVDSLIREFETNQWRSIDSL